MKKIIFLTLIITSFFFTADVFAINEDYFDKLTYDKVASVGGHYYHNSNDLSFSKVLSIHSFDGPFYSFNHTNTYGQNEGYTEFYKFELTKDFHSIFDTDLLVTYDKLYYLELIYYTKNINLTNLQNGMLDAPNNFSFITNDFQTFYNNYEVFEKDWDLLTDDFYSSDHLNTYVTYGRTQCKIADEEHNLYKCRITYKINPNIFHIDPDNPEKSVSGAELVFRLNDKVDEPYANNFIAISQLDFHDNLVGTDDMIPEDEVLPPVDINNSDSNTSANILETIRNIFDTIINLPLNIANAIGGFFTSLAENIANAIHNLFIPSEDFFERNFRVLYMLFEEKMGFLWYPVTLIENFIEYVKAIPNSTDAIFNIPKIEFMGYVLVPAMTYNLMDIITSNSAFSNIYNIYRIFVSGLIVLWLVELAIKKEKEFMGGR